MLFPHGAIGSQNRRFHIAERRDDPIERRRLGGLGAAAGLDGGRSNNWRASLCSPFTALIDPTGPGAQEKDIWRIVAGTFRMTRL